MLLTLLLAAAGPSAVQESPPLLPPRERPLTAAEASGFRRSSRLDEVLAFVEELGALPHGDRLSARTIGRSSEGRPIVAVTASLPGGPPGRANVVVNANIHGGEIEGKVACQLLLRSIALGGHLDVLERLDVTFVPVYNVDGNDAISRRERVTQNGPDGGVGRRSNGMGLDLNRDFVKCEAPETRALLGLVNRLDPIAFLDLHTTNGSAHGYDLTYAPSLSPNAKPDVLAATKALLGRVRGTLEERDGVFTFDYGNFRYAPRERGSRGRRGDPIAWETYDARSRFGTNLMGVRGIVSILSEAYSYLPYERRIEVTHAFTLECLRELARERDALVELVRTGAAEAAFGVDLQLGPVERLPVRVGEIESVLVDLDPVEEGVQEGRRRLASPRAEARLVEMDVARGFRALGVEPIGEAWVLRSPTDEQLELLELHLGAAPRRLREAARVPVAAFLVDEVTRAERPFQGHRVVSVTGAFQRIELDLPAGAAIVPSSILAAQLLHPLSDDSFTTWNLFDEELGVEAEGRPGYRPIHPCLRVDELPEAWGAR
ncbi:MAG: M14 family zinc carboxypeptidase [Planctomycetota bacterium]|nr:M14 family zinc carboxypeptidase [Planctomycetota bacterium]